MGRRDRAPSQVQLRASSHLMAKAKEASVADLMTTGVITCAPDTDLGSVAATLCRAGVHAIFVREKGSAPSGVVTDFDLLAGEWLADDAESLNVMRPMTAGEMMTSPVETISSRALASEAAARLRQLHLSRLLVTNERGLRRRRDHGFRPDRAAR